MKLQDPNWAKKLPDALTDAAPGDLYSGCYRSREANTTARDQGL
jgi:hypothetical protein